MIRAKTDFRNLIFREPRQGLGTKRYFLPTSRSSVGAATAQCSKQHTVTATLDQTAYHLDIKPVLSWNLRPEMPSKINHVAPYHPNEYIQTALTGNKVSRKATILGSQNIILGGKCIIQHGAIIRGDLKRIAPSSAATASSSGQTQPAQSVAIFIGRYCLLAESSVIRPPYKTYKG